MLTKLQRERNNSFFISSLEKMKGGVAEKNSLVFVSEIENSPAKIKPSIYFALEKAKEFNADAVYFKHFENQTPIPQIYIYDFTSKQLIESQIVDIQKKVWSSSIVPLVYIFSRTEVKILDCTKPAIIDKDKEKPNYLEEHISLVNEISNQIENYTFEKIGSGLFWDNWNNPKKLFSFSTSAYSRLLVHLRQIKNEFTDSSEISEGVAQKLIIQSILIKYLEERTGTDGSVVFPQKYFNKYNNANSFCDVLRQKGQILNLFNDLNKNKFNGKIFEWSEEDEIKELKKTNLTKLANFLDGNIEVTGQVNLWRLYSFSHLPVELISRLYEEFLGKNKEGLVYTPPHLANFLINEAMPLESPPNNIEDYTIIDPSCGSGIFLVTAYKRLIQWWRIKNGLDKQIDLDVYKKLLRNNIFGVDIESKAVQLAAFSLSLAICDMISPSQIWQKLKFDDLRERNLISKDFFSWLNSNQTKKFDLVIGNPPFSRGKLEFDNNWQVDTETTFKIPQNQIALKFMCESVRILKPNGLQCLIMHSPSLLYNGSSLNFRKVFFEKYNVLQIIDFTSLARNHVLWDNAEPATVAIFTRNNEATKNNILHLTIRRNKAAINRIYFEIDNYDLHFVSKNDAVNNPYIWKINLLGGGRIKAIINKLKYYETFEKYLKNNKEIFNLAWGEGPTAGTPILPTDAFNESGLDSKQLITSDNGIKEKPYFNPPSLLIKENIGESSLSTYLNSNKYISFRNEIIGINSKNKAFLNKIATAFEINNDLYRFYIYCTSGRVLVSKNTSILKEDLMNLPFDGEKIELSAIEKNVIKDVLKYSQNFIRYGENSIVFNKVKDESFIQNYANELQNSLAIFTANQACDYKVSELKIFKSYTLVKLKYTSKNINIKFSSSNTSNSKINDLVDFKVSESVISRRIIKLYNDDEIILIKPNQIRYWLKSIAYRDADKIFNEMIK